MISNYPIGLPGYHVPGMTLQTGVPLIAQQPPAMQPAPSAATNNSDLLEFSQMIADTKVGMSKIDMKLDEVLKRVDSIKESPSNAVVPLATPDTTSIIDPNIVLSSINKVVEESKALKQELLDRDTRIESLNHKVRQMMENNQRYVEQSQHMMEQRSDSLHSLSSANSSQIIRLQEENSSLKAKAEGAKRKLESRNFEFGETENDVNEMKKRNELLTQKMNVARTKFREKEGEIEELKNEIEKIQREAGREKTARQSTQRETNDLKETIGELRENIRTERQSKKRVQSNLSKIEEELGEVKAERDVMTSTIEDRRRKQQNEKSKLIREMEELKRSHEEELSLLKIQLQQSTGPSQVEMTKIEANWKRKMQLEISKNASTFDERIEELESNELRFKSQIQRLEKKVTNLSIENSTLQKENNRALEELDEFEGVKIREASSQELIERQNSMIEELIRGENELKSCVRTLEESEKGLMDEIQTLGEKNRELESRDESDGDEWRNHVKHVMNKFYASIQVEFPQQNTFTGGQVQTLVKAAITVETMRALNPDLDSTASGTPSEDSLEQVNPAGSPQLHLSSLSPQLTTHVLTGSNEPSRVDSPTPNSPLRIDSPTPNSPLRVDSPTPNSPLRVDSPTPNSPLRIDSPTPNSPLRIDSPTPNSPLRVDSPTPNSPLRIDSPTPNSPLRVDSPTPNSPLRIDSPTPNSPLRVDSPTPNSPLRVDSPTPNSPLRIDSPTPNSPLRVDSPTPNSPLRIDSPTPNSPLRVDSPTPNSPLRVDSPTPNSPLRVDSPTPNSPLRVDSPTPNSPLRVDSPTPNSPLRVDSPTPNTSLRIDSPTPNSAILQTSPPLRHSPILQLESPRTQSPTLLTSPLSHSPPQTSMPDSPTLETAPPIEQSPKQTSPLSQIPLSQPYMDTSTPGPLSFQIPDRKSLNTFVSLDDENSVERSQISSDLMDTGICNTVVPMTIDSLRPSSTNSSQSPTFDTPSQSPDNILPTQTLDLSPSASPVPFQTRTNQSPSPPPIPPSTPPITNTPTATGSTQPDISDTIQVYDATVPPTTRSPPSLSPAHSPPPDISRYTSVPSHSSTPPPMGTDAPDGGELPITGNFSPDLLERHFSDRDKTSDGENELLDQSLPMQITPPIETQFNYPTVKDPLGMMVDKDPLENSADKNPLENNVVEDPLGIAVDKDSSENAANEDLEKTDAKISNPLLDNSSDSESDIFASMKRNTNVVEDEKSAPNSSSVQPQAPKSSIFGDSDDDLDWLS